MLPFQEGESTIEILSLDGKPLGSYTTNQSKYVVNVADLEAGIYVVHIKHNGMTDSKKLTIFR